MQFDEYDGTIQLYKVSFNLERFREEKIQKNK